MAIGINKFGAKAGFTLASSLVVLTGALAAQRALAQDVEDEEYDGIAVEEVIVQGTRQSLQNAQDIKREADTFVDAISASDIGALPDRSVLEAMQRLPGVSIERFAAKNDPDHFSAEGSGAVVRGMTATRTEFNGRDSFTANSGRGLSFQDVAPELMSSVKLYKNQSADMIEGGIGGTVSLYTRLPFDRDGETVSFSMDNTYFDLNETWSPTYSGLYSNRWEFDDLGELGLLLSFAQGKSNSRSDGIQSEIFQTRDRSIFDDSYALGEAYVIVPNGSNVSMKEDDRERNGYSYALQWANPEDTLLATATYLKSDSKLSWNESKISYQGDVVQNRLLTLDTMPAQGTTFEFDNSGVFTNGILANGQGWRAGANDANRIPTGTNAEVSFGDDPSLFPFVNQCTISDAEWNSYGMSLNDEGEPARPGGCADDELVETFGHRFQTTSRVKNQRTVVADSSFNLKYTPNDDWEVILDYQHVDAKTKDDDMEIFLGTVAMQDFSLGGDIPSMSLVNPWDYTPASTLDNLGAEAQSLAASDYFVNPEAYWWKAAMDHYERAVGVEDAARVDVTRFFEDGFVTSLKGGLRQSTRDQEVAYSKYNWKQIAEIWGDDHGTKYTGDDNPYVDGYNAAWLDLPIAESLSGYYEAVDWSSFNRGDGSFTVPGETPNRVLHPSSELANRYMEWGSLLADVTKPADERDGWVPVQDRDIDGDGKADTTGYFLPSELSQISETNTAAYVRMDFETEVAGMRLSGNLGVRYFQIELESTGSIQFPDLIVNDANSAGDRNRYFDELEGDVTYVPTEYRGINEPGFGNNAYVTTTATHKYDDVLPSFNLKVEFTDELLGRFAVSKAVALPDIGKLRNYMSIGAENVQTRLSLGNVDGNDTIQEQQILATYATGWTASAGNPFLMPMESIQYDASLEWYFADVGSLTASVFYKDLSNFFVSGAFPRQVTNPSTDVTETVNVNGVVNSGDGSMSGFELAYQQTYDSLPEPFDGLGTQFNYTYIDAKSVPNPDLAGDPTVDLSDSELADREGIAYTGLPLESQSRHTANAVVFWQKNDWDARLAYNWRSGYLVTARDVINPYRPIWSAAAGYLDGSIFYNVTDELRVGFQGQNLLNTVTKTEMQISEDGYTQGRSWFTNDRRYSLIVRLNF